ncbi:MAG: hypothetical protein NTX53_17155 [candidate division WOR-3 bacterium]|nr:hypothetical protein [candidate division WOR-3 bacterium]
MRRSLLGLLTVVAIAGLLIMSGCEQSSVLRVVQVNNGRTLEADVADWGIWKDPEDPGATPFLVYTIQADTAEIELEYVEVGPGLPTLTPFEAVINQSTITYKSLLDPEITYKPVIIPLTTRVTSDPTGKKTTKFVTTVLPVWWKQEYFDGDVINPPDFDLLDVVEATIKFAGWDSVSGRNVEATGVLLIEIGNFYDNEMTFGR